MRKNYILFGGISVLFFTNIHAQVTPGASGAQFRNLETLTSALSERARLQHQDIRRLVSQGYKEVLSDGQNTKQLVGSDEEGRPLYYTTMNAGAAKMTKASTLYGGGQIPSITGTGIAIGQWDYSKPRATHELLAGRVSYAASQNQTISRHSTNIAGTMVGDNGDPLAKGISYGATLRAYDWIDDVLEMKAEAYDPSSNPSGIVVANNSYGYDPLYLQTYQFGKYNPTARDWDALMYLRPYLQIVKAAGNAREADPAVVPQVTAKGGYDLLEGAGTAKNVMVIASAKKNVSMSSDEDYTVSAFSSYGPTDDGRIKPDFCAPGEDIYSSIDTYDQAYGTYKGTSSATAVVSGIAALLQEYWKSLHAGGYMTSSTLRAILAHTANDRGTYGPDYVYGWGLVDAQRAASAIYNNIEGSTNQEKKTTLIKEVSLSQGSQYVLYVVPYDLAQPLSATLAWTDPEGTIPDGSPDSAGRNLVNDLDLKISMINGDGSETPYYPWKLGGMQDRLSAATRNGTNDVDNIERVDIEGQNLSKTTYKITVSTKSKTTPLLPGGVQTFSLVATNIDFCYMDDLKVLKSPADDISAATTVRAKEIEASNVVKAPTQGVEYIASKTITLLPEFHAEYGSGFHAYITPCFDLVTAMKYVAQSRTESPAAISVPPAPSEKEARLVLYPNPAKESCNIRLRLDSDAAVAVTVYDASGKLVLKSGSETKFPKGTFVKTLDTSSMPSGLYIVTVQAGDTRESCKLIIK